MTLATVARSPGPVEIKAPMLAFLQGQHQQWLNEVRWILDPARGEAAGVWMRWRAIQYLTTSFTRRLAREQRAVASLHDHLTGAHATHLWAAGELLTQLVGRLEHLVGLCHRADDFAAVTLKILTAQEYWCRQVEDALGAVRWGAVSAESRHLFEVISEDPQIQGC